MTAAELLRSAADCVEASVLTDKQLLPIKLAAFHIKDLCGAGSTDRCEQTRLIINLIDAEK